MIKCTKMVFDLFVWIILASSLLMLMPTTDPGLIKWPLLATSLAIACTSWSRVRSIHWLDGLAIIVITFSFINAYEAHDRWAVDLATCIAGLSYMLWRWKPTGLFPPNWLVALFAFIIGLRGILDLFIGSIWNMGAPYAMISFFVHKNMFAYILAPIIWFFGTHALDAKSKKRVIWLGMALFICFVLVSLNSRGAFLGFLVSLGVVGLVNSFKSRSIRPLLTSAAMMLMAFLASFLLMASMATNLGEIGRSVKVKSVEIPRNFHEKTSSEVRAWIWQSTLESWKESPLFGNGTGSTQYRIIKFQKPFLDADRNPYQSAWHAHSHYLEVLNDRGFVGLLLELALLFSALFGYSRRSDASFYGLGALSALAVHNIVAEASEYPASIAMYWGLIGGGIATLSNLSKESFKNNRISNIGKFAFPSLSILLSLLAIRPVVADALTKQALQTSDQSRQLSLYANALDWWPSNPEALMALAVNQAENGRHKDALETLDRLDSVAPGLKYTPIFRSQIYLRSGEANTAEYWAKMAFSQYPYNISVHRSLITAYLMQGKCNELNMLKKEIFFQIDSIYIPFYSQTIKPVPMWLGIRPAVPIPTWAPHSAFDGYLKLNMPDLSQPVPQALPLRDLKIRRASLDSVRCIK